MVAGYQPGTRFREALSQRDKTGSYRQDSDLHKHKVHTSIYTTLNIHTCTQTHRRWCWGMAGRVWLMKLITANIQDLEDSFMGGMGKT